MSGVLPESARAVNDRPVKWRAFAQKVVDNFAGLESGFNHNHF
jgi:hypothetical protein